MYVLFSSCGFNHADYLGIAQAHKSSACITGGNFDSFLALWWSSALKTRTVGDIASISGGFPPFHIPEIPFTWEAFMVILPYSAIIAGVGLIEKFCLR